MVLKLFSKSIILIKKKIHSIKIIKLARKLAKNPIINFQKWFLKYNFKNSKYIKNMKFKNPWHKSYSFHAEEWLYWKFTSTVIVSKLYKEISWKYSQLILRLRGLFRGSPFLCVICIQVITLKYDSRCKISIQSSRHQFFFYYYYFGYFIIN